MLRTNVIRLTVYPDGTHSVLRETRRNVSTLKQSVATNPPNFHQYRDRDGVDSSVSRRMGLDSDDNEDRDDSSNCSASGMSTRLLEEEAWDVVGMKRPKIRNTVPVMKQVITAVLTGRSDELVCAPSRMARANLPKAKVELYEVVKKTELNINTLDSP